ncbi:MAG: radical SAM protein [Chitinispirillaceae bacterium]|nr:radical SAM protein [Chitinispirillaceae bacterium]
MKSRRIKLLLKKASHLPRGTSAVRYALNVLRLMKAKIARDLTQPYPNTLLLEVTNCCQLRCITCAREYRFGKSMAVGHMDLDSAKRVIDEALPYLDKLGLTGLGEPLLYPHLRELAAYVKEKNPGVLQFISTNAQTKNCVPVIEEIGGHIDTLQISIDGIGETYERVRKNADFGAFVKNIGAIVRISKRAGYAIKLNMVVFAENYRDMGKVIEFAHAQGIHEVYCNSLNLVAIDSMLTPHGFYRSPEFLQELLAARETARTLRVRLDYSRAAKQGFSGCPYPWGTYAISWDGFLVPCCAKPFPKECNFGNVFSDGLLPCINHERLQGFRLMAKKNRTPEFCTGCHYVEEHQPPVAAA